MCHCLSDGFPLTSASGETCMGLCWAEEPELGRGGRADPWGLVQVCCLSLPELMAFSLFPDRLPAQRRARGAGHAGCGKHWRRLELHVPGLWCECESGWRRVSRGGCVAVSTDVPATSILSWAGDPGGGASCGRWGSATGPASPAWRSGASWALALWRGRAVPTECADRGRVEGGRQGRSGLVCEAIACHRA